MEETEIIELAEKVKSLGGNPVKVINYYQAELEKAMELIRELISKRDSRFMHDVVVKAGAFINEGKK